MYNLAQMVNKQITSFITIKKKGKIPPVAWCLWLYKKFSQLYCGNAMPCRGLMTDSIVQAQRKKIFFFFFLHIGFFIWLIKTEVFLLLICVLTPQREWNRHVEQPLWHRQLVGGTEREAVRRPEYFKWEIASDQAQVKWIERLQEKAVVWKGWRVIGQLNYCVI